MTYLVSSLLFHYQIQNKQTSCRGIYPYRPKKAIIETRRISF